MKLGTDTRTALKEANAIRNKEIVVKKGDVIKVTKLVDTTINGEHVYDRECIYSVLSIRKGKDGRRVKVKDLKFGYELVFLIDISTNTIEMIEEA